MSFGCIFSNRDDAMKDSLGVALRHSQEQAQNTYDGRTANQKKAPAVQFPCKKAEVEMEQEDDDGEQSSRSDNQSGGRFCQASNRRLDFK